MFPLLTILLGTVCLGLLIPTLLLIHYAGLRILLVPFTALLMAVFLGLVGAGFGWMIVLLLEASPTAIAIGTTIGATIGLVLGGTIGLQTTKR